MPDVVSGFITRIVSYTDGTSQIGIIPQNTDKAYESFPFFSPISGEYLGCVVDIREIKRNGRLIQNIEGVNFSITSIETKSQIARIKERGREVLEELTLSEEQS